jgi:hypothetical protein
MMDKRTYRIFNGGDSPNWDAIPPAEIDHALWLPPPEGIRAFARLSYTRDSLKVRLDVREKEPLSRFMGLLDPVCCDSCLEFFFSPVQDDSRYFNFEFNPAGALCLGFGRDRQSSIRQISPGYRNLFSVAPFVFDGGWGVCFEIPASFVRLYAPLFQLEPGLVFQGNFYKCGDETQTPHYLAWNPVNSDHPDFHRPGDFGSILLA